VPTEVWRYFIKKYEKATFRVAPYHWPDFQSKEEVDMWIEKMGKMVHLAFDAAFNEDSEL